ncbi:hypothetical protein BJX63DRAFT_423005 [Aspergillus granulosus]|uniref:Uncharacterized protein n=1 Tax=Aspergillus granulosus TaxID=176169 RepID=A0ABR4H506_9EURO
MSTVGGILSEYMNGIRKEYPPVFDAVRAKVPRRFQQHNQTEIAEYLIKPIPQFESKQPTGGFQITVVPCNFQLLPQLGIPTLDAINAVLGLPGHSHHYASVSSGAIGMFVLEDKSWLFARPRAPDFSSISIILRYDSTTNITRGLFYTDMGFPHFKNIISELEACPHPVILPTLASELILDTNASTGYGFQNKKGAGNFQDYRTLVKELSKARSGVHLSLATLTSTRWMVEYILNKIEWVDARLAPGTREGLLEASRVLTEEVEFARNHLFNLITQNDSLLSTSIAQDSREIAAATKRDSSSMKILAFLTTFSFPATFISMPFFNWETDKPGNVTGPHFWVFWAVTVPLTVVIMIGVVMWAMWHQRHIKATEMKERQNFSQVVADEADRLKRAATMRTAEVTP